jgi:hypothetical protein
VSQRFRHRFFYFLFVGVRLRNYFAFHGDSSPFSSPALAHITTYT